MKLLGVEVTITYARMPTASAINIQKAIKRWCNDCDSDGECQLRKTRYDNCRCEQQTGEVWEQIVHT